MTYFINDLCICCKYTQCVTVCPVDCFIECENFLVIKQSECIDCGLCETECPVNAIKKENETSIQFIKINNFYSKLGKKIIKKKKELPYVNIWKKTKNKIKYLQINFSLDRT